MRGLNTDTSKAILTRLTKGLAIFGKPYFAINSPSNGKNKVAASVP